MVKPSLTGNWSANLANVVWGTSPSEDGDTIAKAGGHTWRPTVGRSAP